ncbi:hypothetical protein KAI87_02485, partial [Myxococcota bacterium]|nr:hypothetical protein [Myxococcota bacterium]
GFVDGENDLQARDPTTYEVILSGNIGSTATETDNTYHVVTGQDVDQTALLDGVTVTAGYANGGGDAAHGGGLWLQNTTARILSCKVDANYAIENGGGAYVSGLSDSSGPLFENLVIWTHNSASQGGAIFAETSQLSIHGNIFANNLSRQGGAIFADHSNLTITDSGLNANKASLDSANGNGGALYQNAGTVFVHDCLFLENEAGTGANASADQAGEDGGHGGAIYAVSATLDIVESNIHYNAAGSGGNAWLPESETTCEKVSPAGAGGKGGAIFATTTAIRIWNSMLRSNTGGHGGSDAENTSYTGGDCIEDSGSGGHGGAIFQSGGSLEMLNSFVYQNSAGDKPATNANAGSSSAAGYGGAIYLSAATSHIINTTMSLNTTGHNDTGKPENSGHGGGVAMNGSNQLSIQNSILWDNKRWGPSIIEDNLWLPQDEVATVSYSVLDSGAAVHMSAGSLGNIFNDPGFLNPDEAANYTLIPSSPCIDAGNNDFLPEDIFDLDGDGNITELAPLDYEGLPRRVDDVAEDDTGEGIAPIVDMGAFEAQ